MTRLLYHSVARVSGEAFVTDRRVGTVTVQTERQGTITGLRMAQQDLSTPLPLDHIQKGHYVGLSSISESKPNAKYRS